QLDVKGPLSHFTPTRPNEKYVWKLTTTINHADADKEVPEPRLQKAFKRVWPDFEKAFQEIREAHKKEAKPAPREAVDMVKEILEISRALQRNSEQLLQRGPEIVTQWTNPPFPVITAEPSDPAQIYWSGNAGSFYSKELLRMAKEMQSQLEKKDKE